MKRLFIAGLLALASFGAWAQAVVNVLVVFSPGAITRLQTQYGLSQTDATQAAITQLNQAAIDSSIRTDVAFVAAMANGVIACCGPNTQMRESTADKGAVNSALTDPTINIYRDNSNADVTYLVTDWAGDSPIIVASGLDAAHAVAGVKVDSMMNDHGIARAWSKLMVGAQLLGFNYKAGGAADKCEAYWSLEIADDPLWKTLTYPANSCWKSDIGLTGDCFPDGHQALINRPPRQPPDTCTWASGFQFSEIEWRETVTCTNYGTVQRTAIRQAAGVSFVCNAGGNHAAWSNPFIMYAGRPFGTTNQNAAGVIKNRAATVATWRNSKIWPALYDALWWKNR